MASNGDKRSEREIVLSCLRKTIKALDEYQKVCDGEQYLKLGEYRCAIAKFLEQLNLTPH